MRLSHSSCRRALLVCAVVIVSVGLALALGIIQPVKAEVDRGGTPEKALRAFWVNIGMNLISALAIFSIVMLSSNPGWISKSVLVVAGLMVLFLGIALADAGSAYMSHGPAMKSASVLLFICAAVDFFAGIITVGAAILLPKNTELA